MKITRIEVYAHTFKLKTVYRLSGGRVYEGMESTFVALHTDEDLTGWGEGCPWGANYAHEFVGGLRAGIAELAPTILGRDPVGVEAMTEVMDAALKGHWYVKSAIDAACWDIAGKVARRPTCDLLGGQYGGDIRINRGIQSGAPDDMLAQLSKYREEGFDTFSCKLSGSDLTADIEGMTALLTSRLPHERFTADYNGGLSVADAITFSSAVKDPHLTIEQPCRTYEACAAAAPKMRHPVRLDEIILSPADVHRALSDGIAQSIVIKIGRIGGLTKARRIRDLCALSGVTVLVQDSGGSDVSTAAIASFARSTPPAILHSGIDLRYFADHVVFDGLPNSVGGCLVPSGAPGLGVEPRSDMLGKPIAVYEL